MRGDTQTNDVFSVSSLESRFTGAHTQTHFLLDLQPASPHPAADFHPNSISLSPSSTAFPP
ncbi:hypothetical protein CY34DRAFT_205330 [Suillus luteus UH-Slu-Lm8-n1]|uniref:Uncharacterized protein n=1 Tax=Suillus luteus UH-Slu-Lm8-n1 TaxID=930992 RepID=A0A0D0A1D8_9AGAM|nr:hypothetical protein CY34DRAFT_205330 [Suillus luteus UH-Slu-Lm8-n1]